MNRRRGFTLIELLVVVAVIALLIGILLPSLASARASGETLKASVAVRSLMQAYVLYANDHDGLVLPGKLRAADATGVRDEFGNELDFFVGQRWVHRLAPYFDYVWGGTTHVGARAKVLADRQEVIAGNGGPFGGGEGSWTYDVSIYPSFGLNYLYMGGDYELGDGGGNAWIKKGYHVRRLSDPIASSEMLTFASSRFLLSAPGFEVQEDGYLWVEPPPFGSSFDELQPTSGRRTRFGWIHPRYQEKAVVGWADGHSSTLDEAGLLDRQHWANPARAAGDPNWEPD